MVIDDNHDGLGSLEQFIIELWPQWRWVYATGRDEALEMLKKMVSTGLPNLVSVDLGLEPNPGDPGLGLELLEEIHDLHPYLRLAVHSGLAQKDLDAGVLHRILSIPASYIATRNQNSVLAFAANLPLMAAG